MPFAPVPKMVAPALLFTIPLFPAIPSNAPEMVPKLLTVSALAKPPPVSTTPMFVPVTDAPGSTLMILRAFWVAP